LQVLLKDHTSLQSVLVDLKDGVFRITMNRPKRFNAFNIDVGSAVACLHDSHITNSCSRSSARR
jgi:enoyl-CoA hydratase/carnithine racemase